MSITPEQIEPVLDSMYNLRTELVPCFLGEPGIGKTQGVYRFAERIGVNVVTFILSNTVPSEVSGIRIPDKDTKRMEVFDDARMASLKDGDILFFDEVLEAPPVLQAAVLTLIQDRIMASGRKLPDVFIVAASNPVFNPKALANSFKDRFIFLEVKFNQTEWVKWISSREPDLDEQYLESLASFMPYLSSDGYNLLSPRKATKLLEYVLDPSADWETKQTVLRSQFGDTQIVGLYKRLYDIRFDADKVNAQILRDLLGSLEITLPEDLPVLTLDQLFDFISASPDREKIEEAMKGVLTE